MKPPFPAYDDFSHAARYTRSLSSFVRSAIKCPRCEGKTLSNWIDGQLVGHVCQDCPWTESRDESTRRQTPFCVPVPAR